MVEREKNMAGPNVVEVDSFSAVVELLLVAAELR